MRTTLSLPWRLAQGTAVVVLAAFVAALALDRRDVLDVFWMIVIPVLPASFLVAPMLWRNVCPLATINHWTGDRTGRQPPSPQTLRMLQWTGIALLFVLVPLRHVVLNTIPVGMLALVAVVGVIVLLAGVRWAVRAGFCNGLCPVRPVELLYGQRPLVDVPRARCATCVLCVPVGCPDVWRARTMPRLIDNHASRPWFTEPFGFFTLAFPGLVLAYFLTTDLTPWTTVYGLMLVLVAASVMTLGGLIALLKPSRALATAVLAALAFGLYYWYAAPGFAEAIRLPGGPWPVRTVAGLLLLVWVVPRGPHGNGQGG
jgi:hypothetical protein